MGRNNTYPQLKEEEKEELFKEHNDFFNKYTNYEANNLKLLENVYRGIDDNPKIRMHIRNNRYNISFPLFVTMLFLIPIVLFTYSFFWSGMVSSILIALFSLLIWSMYFDSDNKKDVVLVCAYKDLAESEVIEVSELPALKSLLLESEMIELLRCYNKEIPVSKVIDLIDYYKWDFKNWEVRQLYLDI